MKVRKEIDLEQTVNACLIFWQHLNVKESNSQIDTKNCKHHPSKKNKTTTIKIFKFSTTFQGFQISPLNKNTDFDARSE